MTVNCDTSEHLTKTLLCEKNTKNKHVEQNISNLYCVAEQLMSVNNNEWRLMCLIVILIVILIVKLKQ